MVLRDSRQFSKAAGLYPLVGERRMSRSNCYIGLALLLVQSVVVTSAIAQSSSLTSRGRKLAPDALEVIPPPQEYGETYQGPVDLPFVSENPDLAWEPNYLPKAETLLEEGKDVVFRSDVYGLEFAFKPVRQIEIEVPTAEGYRRKNVWYLLYRVRYLGGDLKPMVEEAPFDKEVYTTQAVSAAWVRFMPTFTLEDRGSNQRYLDKILPAAKRAIAAKERVGSKVYDSVEIQRLKIELDKLTENNAVWGVATWVDVDPRTDFFTIEVKGLTNAQKIESENGQLKYRHKTLVLNFARPGDARDEIRDRITFGIPAIDDPQRQKYVLDQFGVKERLDYRWIYR